MKRKCPTTKLDPINLGYSQGYIISKLLRKMLFSPWNNLKFRYLYLILPLSITKDKKTKKLNIKKFPDQTRNSLTFPGFPWPFSNSLTFPGFPGFPGPWEPWVFYYFFFGFLPGDSPSIGRIRCPTSFPLSSYTQIRSSASWGIIT